MASEKKTKVMLQYAKDWDSLTEAEKREVARGMAKELQKVLGRA